MHLSRADEAAGDGDVVPAATDDEQKPRLGWLLETRKPKELQMYEVPYRGPRSCGRSGLQLTLGSRDHERY